MGCSKRYAVWLSVLKLFMGYMLAPGPKEGLDSGDDN